MALVVRSLFRSLLHSGSEGLYRLSFLQRSGYESIVIFYLQRSTLSILRVDFLFNERRKLLNSGSHPGLDYKVLAPLVFYPVIYVEKDIIGSGRTCAGKELVIAL